MTLAELIKDLKKFPLDMLIEGLEPLTVKWLIEELEKHPSDALVYEGFLEEIVAKVLPKKVKKRFEKKHS